MVLNQKIPRHYMCIGRNIWNGKLEFDDLFLENSKEDVLRVAIENTLTFDSHIKNTCRKADQKPGALLGIRNYWKLKMWYIRLSLISAFPLEFRFYLNTPLKLTALNKWNLKKIKDLISKIFDEQINFNYLVWLIIAIIIYLL